MSWSETPQNRPQEVCRQGHLLTGRRFDGRQYCVKCKQVTDRAAYERHRLAIGKPAKSQAVRKYVRRQQPDDKELDRIALRGWNPEWGARG